MLLLFCFNFCTLYVLTGQIFIVSRVTPEEPNGDLLRLISYFKSKFYIICKITAYIVIYFLD